MNNNAEVIKAVRELIQLDHDATKAYQKAIDSIKEKEICTTLESFQQDHERHIAELASFLTEQGETPPDRSRDLKGFFIEGMTSLQSKMGTKAALMAMRTNEKLTNKRYRDALDNAALPPEARAIIKRNYEDEQRHLQHIHQMIEREPWKKQMREDTGQVSSF